MRCLTLACELRRSGADVVFICKHLGGTAGELIARHGLQCECLDDELTEADDCRATCETALRLGARLLIVDHYGIGPESHREFRRHGFRLAVIDDEAGQPALNCDLILNQNAGITADCYADSPAAVKLCGPRYVLLRDAVRAARSNRTVAEEATRLLVTLGGADPSNITRCVLSEAMQLSQWKQIVVVTTAAFVHTASLYKPAETDARVRLVENPRKLPELMTEADLAVTAGGSTCYECAYLGLPNIAIQTADNQAVVCRGLAEAGCLQFAGQADQLEPGELSSALGPLIDNPKQRGDLSRRGQRLIDGLGVLRVVRHLLRLLDIDRDRRAA